MPPFAPLSSHCRKSGHGPDCIDTYSRQNELKFKDKSLLLLQEAYIPEFERNTLVCGQRYIHYIHNIYQIFTN